MYNLPSHKQLPAAVTRGLVTMQHQHWLFAMMCSIICDTANEELFDWAPGMFGHEHHNCFHQFSTSAHQSSNGIIVHTTSDNFNLEGDLQQKQGGMALSCCMGCTQKGMLMMTGTGPTPGLPHGLQLSTRVPWGVPASAWHEPNI